MLLEEHGKCNEFFLYTEHKLAMISFLKGEPSSMQLKSKKWENGALGSVAFKGIIYIEQYRP